MSREQEFGPWKVTHDPFKPGVCRVYRRSLHDPHKVENFIDPRRGRPALFSSASHAYGWILTQGMQQTMNHQPSTETTGLSVEEWREWWARRRKPGTPPPASRRADIAGCSVLYFAGDSTVIVHGPSGFVTMTPDNQRADLPSRLLCELALAVLANRPDFEAVKDKCMGELTPAQQDDAREQWLRNSWQTFLHTGEHIEFLLRRLDAARGVVA